MKRDDALHAQVPLFKVIQKTPREHVNGFAGLVQIDDDERPLTRKIRHQHRLGVLAGGGIQVNGHLAVRDDLFSATVSSFSGAGFVDSASGTRVCGPFDDLLDEPGVTFMSNDRKPLGDRGPDASRVIEMVMAVHDVRQRFRRDEARAPSRSLPARGRRSAAHL